MAVQQLQFGGAGPTFIQPDRRSQRRIEMARALQQQGADTSPTTGLGAISRIAQALSGRFQENREQGIADKRQETALSELARAMGIATGRPADTLPEGVEGPLRAARPGDQRQAAQILGNTPGLEDFGAQFGLVNLQNVQQAERDAAKLKLETARTERETAAANLEARDRAKFTSDLGTQAAADRQADKPVSSARLVNGNTEEGRKLGIPPGEVREVTTTNGVVTNIERPASSTNIQVGSKLPPGALQESLDLSSRADTLWSSVSELQSFAEIARQTETGFFTPLTLPIRAALADLGFSSDDEQVTLGQLFKAKAAMQALRFRNPDSGFGLTGNTSNRDLTFLESITANLRNTDGANQVILITLVGKMRRDAQLADLKAELVATTGSVAGWRKKREEFIENTPLLTEDEVNLLRELNLNMTGRNEPATIEDALDPRVRALVDELAP